MHLLGLQPKPSKGRMRIHMLENVDKALTFLKKQKVQLNVILPKVIIILTSPWTRRRHHVFLHIQRTKNLETVKKELKVLSYISLFEPLQSTSHVTTAEFKPPTFTFSSPAPFFFASLLKPCLDFSGSKGL